MDDPLGLPPAAMREMGYRMIDYLVDQLADPFAVPPLTRATRHEMELRLHGPAPEAGRPFEDVVAQLDRDVLPFTSRGDHPAYFAFIPSCGTWPSALGDLVASAMNVYAGSWMESAGPSQLELTVLDWFRQWVGYPEGTGGILLSGGSAANMTALACAREARLGAMADDVVVYVSDQAHSSMARAARVLGFRPDQVRVLPVDRQFRMRPDALARSIDADRAAGYRPLLAAASAGSTNTGAIDPLPEIAAVCHERGVWFHVDAAYGGFAALTERGRGWLEGIEQADSITLDPHKWLYQPFECGCLLVRDRQLLRDAFELTPDYLQDTEGASGEVNFSDLGFQLTRMSRAFKLWMSLTFYGVAAYRAAIDRSLDLAKVAERRIDASAELELLRPATLGIVCFRRRPAGLDDEATLDALNARLVEGLADSGVGLISSTRLHGVYALRMCVLNHTTREEDIERVLQWLESAEVTGLHADGHTAARLSDEERGWGQLVPAPGAPADAELLAALRTVAVFRRASDDEVAWLLSHCEESVTAEGDTIISEWTPGRDVYVVVDGTCEVRRGGEPVAIIEAGETFGEVSALDWGASFGYPHLASVTAVTKCRLLVIPNDAFRLLVRTVPGLAADLKRVAGARLP